MIFLPILIMMILLLVNPQEYTQSFYQGLMIFCISVLPSMFPFFFFTKLLTSLGLGKYLSSLFSKPCRLLFNAPDVGGYIWCMSLISGYPIGAKLVSDFYESGQINSKQAKKLVPFTSSSGPLFILGTVGVSIFNNYLLGLVVLISHILSTLVNGLIFRGKKIATDTPLLFHAPQYDKALSDSVYNSVTSILIVGAYIALFNMLGDMLKGMGVIEILSKALSTLLSPFSLENSAEALLFGFVEMTRGCLLLSQSGISPVMMAGFSSLIVTFGGLGICIQSMTFLGKCGVSPLYYLITKTTQSLIAFGFALLFSTFIL